MYKYMQHDTMTVRTSATMTLAMCLVDVSVCIKYIYYNTNIMRFITCPPTINVIIHTLYDRDVCLCMLVSVVYVSCIYHLVYIYLHLCVTVFQCCVSGYSFRFA